jgi:hypothetical protein
MLRQTLFILVLAAAPALAQQPTTTPAKSHAMGSDTTKAKPRHKRHAAPTKAKGTAAHDSTAHRDSTSHP